MIHLPIVAMMFGDGDLLERPGSAQSMVMPDTARRYTIDEVLAFPPDGNRYELVDGALLVTPSPAQRHQLALGQLYLRVGGYVGGFPNVARVFLAPADIIWGPDEYVQPDLFVVPAGEVTGNWRDCRSLLLAAEVVSPASARGDRVTKRRLYQRRRVATYWVVDTDARAVEVWHPDDARPEVVTDRLRWRLAPEAPELVIPLEETFRDLPA
jgi:Uma2 family endonuclease